MQSSYIRVIYARGKILLIAILAIVTIFITLRQVAKILPSQVQESKMEPTKIPSSPTIFFVPEDEEKIIAEVQALSISEVRQQLQEKASEELQALINQGVISDETLRELLIIMSNF